MVMFVQTPFPLLDEVMMFMVGVLVMHIHFQLCFGACGHTVVVWSKAQMDAAASHATQVATVRSEGYTTVDTWHDLVLCDF